MASPSRHFVPSETSLQNGLASVLGPARSFVTSFRDLPVASRYVGHLLLLFLLVLVTKQVFPRDFTPFFWSRLSSFRSSTIPSPSLAAQPTYESDYGLANEDGWGLVSTSGRYLEASAAPLTIRVLRDILPMNVPQRTVRTQPINYVVAPGDTPLGIAEKFGIKGTTLLWSNPKLEEDPDFLQVGQELTVLPVDGVLHTVAKNETLESIASKYKVDVATIAGYAANHVDAASKLEANQTLVIPGGVKPIVIKKVVVDQEYQAKAPSGSTKGTGRFAWPTTGLITQKSWSGHVAIDIYIHIGTPIYAADAGYVAMIKRQTGSYGLQVLVDHGNGYQTRYAHLSAVYVEVGQSVARGDKIAASGNTGKSTGPHLHFEVIENGVRVNPLRYLQ
jgi:LysM repeat protein